MVFRCAFPKLSQNLRTDLLSSLVHYSVDVFLQLLGVRFCSEQFVRLRSSFCTVCENFENIRFLKKLVSICSQKSVGTYRRITCRGLFCGRLRRLFIGRLFVERLFSWRLFSGWLFSGRLFSRRLGRLYSKRCFTRRNICGRLLWCLQIKWECLIPPRRHVSEFPGIHSYFRNINILENCLVSTLRWFIWRFQVKS